MVLSIFALKQYTHTLESRSAEEIKNSFWNIVFFFFFTDSLSNRSEIDEFDNNKDVNEYKTVVSCYTRMYVECVHTYNAQNV